MKMESKDKVSGVALGRENEIVTFAPASFVGRQSNVQLGSWFQSSAAHPVCRRLFNESNITFLSLQKAAAASMDQKTLARFSLQYRSILKACIEELDEKSHLNEEDEELEGLLFKLELIWHLVEIMFIDEKPCGVVIPQLLSWVQWHFNQCEAAAKSCLQAEVPDQDPQYWNAVYGFLLHGRLDDARKLLREHKHYDSDAFQSCDELLKKMPTFGDYAGQSLTELEMRWGHWQRECEKRLLIGEFSPYPQLEVAVKVLCGDVKTLTQLSHLVETWYELMVAVLLYTKPTVRYFELKAATQECIPMFTGSSMGDNTPIGAIVRAAFECDINLVISESQASLDNCWFTAHLADIIHHSTPDDTQLTSGGVTLREWLLLEFTSVLMGHDSLWQLAVDYLDFCPVYGRHYLQRYLLAMPIQSKKKANKVIAVAQERGLSEIVISICKSRGKWMLSRGQLGGSLAWALKSSDPSFSSHLAECFLKHYIEHGKFATPDLLDHLGPMMLITDKLAFLGKFKEFDKLYKEEKLKEAADVLVSLISSQMAPKYFGLSLFMNALPLLERKEGPVVVSADQTRELMAALEELDSKDLPEDRLHTIRLALARNLAGAIVFENNEDPF